MTVNELISMLNNIEDKDTAVVLKAKGSDYVYKPIGIGQAEERRFWGKDADVYVITGEQDGMI